MLILDPMLSPMVIKKELILQKHLVHETVMLADQITKLKTDVLNERILPFEVDLVRPEIAESWLRSKNYNIDLACANQHVQHMDRIGFQQLIREKQPLIHAAGPYIQQLANMLSNTKATVTLTDEKGVVLRLDGYIGTSISEVNLEPGSIWNESTIGTCAHGMSLVLEAPVQVWGPEHYCEIYSEAAGSAAPLFDITGNLIGILAVTHEYYLQNETPHAFGLTVSAAWAIQNQFHLSAVNGMFNAAFEAGTEAFIAINKKGVITQANVVAQKLFHYLKEKMIGMRIEDLLGAQPIIKSVMQTGKAILDPETEIECWNMKLNLCSVKPIIDNYGHITGCVLNLKSKNPSGRIVRQSKSEAALMFEDIIGSSPELVKTKSMAQRYARLEYNILIQGESGTGKEIFAQAIHNESCPEGAFIAVNCAAIPRTLIEAELFGYEGGAFTGAEHKGRIGKIEMADGGTLFLDEIGDMPLEIQPVLLRVLEEKKITRVGGSRCIPVNFRLVTASNKNLSELVRNNQFREDLYYRLSVFKITIPPLRDRKLDIIKLAHFFIDAEAEKRRITAPSLSEEVKYRLLQFHWPGNVRQLQNAVIYAVNTSMDGRIKVEDLPEEIANHLPYFAVEKNSLPKTSIKAGCITEGIVLKDVEAGAIVQALHQTEGNIPEAAALLGLSRSTMYRRIKKFDLQNSFRCRHPGECPRSM